MKTENKHPRDDALLDAVLGDDSWPELNADVKSAALGGMRARHRRRQFMFWSAQAAAIALIAAGVLWWQRPVTATSSAPGVAQSARMTATPSTVVASVTAVETAGAPQSSLPAYISEKELMALFPKGSCEVVEIDGTKQLVFYDRKVEREGAIYQPGG